MRIYLFTAGSNYAKLRDDLTVKEFEDEALNCIILAAIIGIERVI